MSAAESEMRETERRRKRNLIQRLLTIRRSGKFVPYPVHRMNEQRVFWIFLQLEPDVLDVGIDAPLISFKLVSECAFDKVPSREDLTRSACKDR